jgi:hypothetical protein
MEEKRDVVMCSETLFPDLFAVDEREKMPSADGAQGTSGDGVMAYDGMDDCDDNSNGLDATDASRGAACGDSGASTVDLQLYMKQVDVNMALFKQRIFAVLKLFHTPDEEHQVYQTINDLQRDIDECPALASMLKFSVAQEKKSGRPLSASGSGSSTAPLTTQQKETLRSLQTIDSTFRFALEEIALRWASKQDRPFNLKTYHDVASAQIELRQQARHAQGVSEAKVREQQKSIEEVTRRLAVHDETHAEHMKLYLQELQLLRAQILDMQRRLKVQEDIPQLLGKSDAEGPAMYQVAHEKHVEFINRRLTEECALLVHTLEQRNQVVKSLQVELTQTKQAAAVVRDEFRKYITEQERLDTEFRAQYAQNEAAMNQAIASHATELEKNKVLTQNNKRLTDEVNHLHLESDALKADLHETQVELGQLKRQQAQQLEENRNLRSALEETKANMTRQKEMYEQQLETARRRIEELERNDIKAKLEEALGRIRELTEEVSELQQTVANEKARFAAAEEQHKKTTRDFEKKIRQMEEAREIAEKRRVEALEAERKRFKEQADKRVQAVEQEKTEQALAFQHQLDAGEKFQEDLLHEIMLGHRQINIVERFLACGGALGKEQLRDLAKQLMAADIPFGASAEGQSQQNGDDSSVLSEQTRHHHHSHAHSGEQHSEDSPHTPRTLEYFTNHRPFDPTDMQQRISIANDALESVRTQVHRPTKSTKNVSDAPGGVVLPALMAHLAKSTVTLDFLHGVKDRLESRTFVPQGFSDGTLSASASMAGSSVNGQEPSRTSAVTGSTARLEASVRQQLSLAPAWESNNGFSPNSTAGSGATFGGAGSNADPLTASASVRRVGGLMSGEAMMQQMVMEELKSQVVVLKIREEALLEEIHKHQDEMFSGGIQTRPSSGDNSSRPQSGNRRRSFAGGQSFVKSKSMGAMSMQRSSASNVKSDGMTREESFGVDDAEEGEGREIPLSFIDFPGLENAVEYLDMFESFEQMRAQLRQLVEVCTLDAQRGALDPHDLDRAKELLHAKFMCFRAVEGHATNVLQRLHRKKDDIMRRREEELEKVLGAMQNLSLTHPTEARQLVKAARVARQQQSSTLQRQAAADTSLTAVIERPHSSMSSSQAMRKLAVAPQDVIVSGAAALMCLRGSQQRATGSAKPGNRSK